MVDVALAAGVNYFDTAWPYHDSMSEIALGKSLARYPRDRFVLATKYPGHQIADTYEPAPIFEAQLEKCQVDYFDYYLLHNVYENSIDVYMDERWGIADYFVEQKKNGRVKRLGFSCHGRPETLEKFLAYGARKYAELKEADPETAALFAGENIMEFCQIQLNYLDWTLQDAAEKYALLDAVGLPIVVMEPLRGGKLVNLPEDVAAKLREANPERAPLSWAFRWLQDLPRVKVVLSGMSSVAQVEENCALFSGTDSLSADETAALLDAAEMLKSGVPCTACRYCTDSCPQEIDIPLMMASYNDLKFQPSFTVAMQLDAVPEGQMPADCIGCGACASMCPQGIDIPTVMRELADTLAGMPSWADLCKQREGAAKAAAAAQGA